MKRKLDRNEMSEKLIEVTLRMIEERGGLQGVNLRQIALRANCAHTNIYNYYQNFEELLWDVFARIGEIWAQSAMPDIKPGNSLEEISLRTTSTQIDFALAHPGWYRCLWLEPLSGKPPQSIIDARREQRDLIAGLIMQSGQGITREFANELFMILFSYVHGSICLMINGRIYRSTLPEYKEHILRNASFLLETLKNQTDFPQSASKKAAKNHAS